MRADVRGGAGAALLLVSDTGCVAAAPVGTETWNAAFDVPGGARYVRAEVVDATGLVLALSNPIWSESL